MLNSVSSDVEGGGQPHVFEVVARSAPSQLPESEESNTQDSTKKDADKPTEVDNEHDSETPKQKQTEESSKKTDETPEEQYRDPLRMFGILIPPALRSAQATFMKTVDKNIPELLQISSKMRQLEIEIRRTRKHVAKASSKSSTKLPGS